MEIVYLSYVSFNFLFNMVSLYKSSFICIDQSGKKCDHDNISLLLSSLSKHKNNYIYIFLYVNRIKYEFFIHDCKILLKKTKIIHIPS